MSRVAAFVACLVLAGEVGCGPCARAGQQQVFEGSVNAVTADDTAVYFATDDAIWKAPFDSQQAVKLASADYALEIAVDGAQVYWAESRGNDAIMSVAKDGGAATAISAGTNTPHGLAVDGQTIYWSDGGGNYIATAPEAGGPRVELTVVPPSDPARDYIEPVAFAFDATTLYWMDWTFVTIMAMPKSGGPASSPIQGPYGVPGADSSTSNNPRAFALFQGALYWVNDATSTGVGQVLSLPAGAQTPVVLADGASVGDGIAVDAGGVFWSGDTSIFHVDSQGAVTTVASDLLFATRMIVAGGALYYIDGSAQSDSCAGLWAIDNSL